MEVVWAEMCYYSSRVWMVFCVLEQQLLLEECWGFSSKVRERGRGGKRVMEVVFLSVRDGVKFRIWETTNVNGEIANDQSSHEFLRIQ